jgi:hypothetical protein
MFAKTIELSESKADIRREVNVLAKTAIQQQWANPFGQHFGRVCWFAFVDHSTMGFDPHFYLGVREKKPQPRSLMQISSVIKAMLEKSILVAGGGQSLAATNIDHVGRIFYELFLNTHEHGSRGKNREDWIKPGIRLIYTNGINLGGRGVERQVGDDLALDTFAARVPSQHRYIEISMIDSGFGYVGRWLADHPNEPPVQSIAEEYALFKRCFSFRQSSSGEPQKGNGLPVVMELLTALRGFLRVRSGRLSLYRDFVANPYQESDSCDLFDGATAAAASAGVTKFASVEGVAITFLIPLEAKV